MSQSIILSNGKTCKRGHKMTLVGRGDKKHFVCNACRRLAGRSRGNSWGGRRMAASVLWSAEDFIPFKGEPITQDDDTDDYGLEALQC